MELFNLFIFLGFSYFIRLFNFYHIIFYFLILSISLQVTINENPKLIDNFIELKNKYKIQLYENSSKHIFTKFIVDTFIKANDLYINGRDVVVYFIGRNFVNTFLPKEIATLMLDENMHSLMNPRFKNNVQGYNNGYSKVEELIDNQSEESTKKVFNNESDMFNFLENLKEDN